MEEEKEYLPIDLSQGKRYKSFDVFMQDTCTPEEREEAARLADTLILIRINAQISLVMTVAVLNCTHLCQIFIRFFLRFSESP